MQIVFSILIIFCSFKSFSSDTVKIYMGGVLPFNKMYILQEGKLIKVKVGTGIKTITLVLKDEEELERIKFYYKFGLLSKRKLVNIPARDNTYLHFYFGLEGLRGGCRALWAEREILNID